MRSIEAINEDIAAIEDVIKDGSAEEKADMQPFLVQLKEELKGAKAETKEVLAPAPAKEVAPNKVKKARSLVAINGDIAAVKDVIKDGTPEEQADMQPALEQLQKELKEAKAGQSKEVLAPAPAKKAAPKKVEKTATTPDAKPKYKKGDKFFKMPTGYVMKVTSVPTKRGDDFLYQINKKKRKSTGATIEKLLASGEWSLVYSQNKKNNAGDAKADKVQKLDKPTEGTGNSAMTISWRKKLDPDFVAEGEQVVLATTFIAVKAKDKIEADLKSTANAGDYVLVNEDGHVNSILTGTMADRFMKKGEFEKKYVLAATLEKYKKEIAQYKEQYGELEVAAKPADKPAAAKPADKPKAAKPADKPKAAKPADKPKKKCGPDAYEAAEIVAKVMSFLEKHSIAFHKIHKSKEWLTNAHEIKAVYIGIGNAPSKIYVHLKNHKIGFAFSSSEWHTLCLDSWKLTRIKNKDVPKPQQRRKVVQDNDLKAIFTTDGTDRFRSCMVMYGELYKCQKDGNCSAADKEKYKTIYQTCGNLGRKFEILQDQMKVLYDEARANRDEEGMPWSEALQKAIANQKKLANN